jgi:hypothetical protein
MKTAATYLWNVLKHSTSFRAAVATYLTMIGGAYSAGQELRPVVVAGGLAVLATVLTKCFDESMQTEKSTEPPKA